MTSIIIMMALTILSGCADMKIANIKIKDAPTERSGSIKAVPYSIDTEYLESKFVDFFEVSHNEEELKKVRSEFLENVRAKIKNSMPPDSPYLSGQKTNSLQGRHIIFVPVIRSMPDEKNGFVTASCDITARIYDGDKRLRSVKVSDTISLKYDGQYAFIGTVEYYKTFMWEDSLILKLEEAQNQVFDSALKKILDRLSTL